MSTNEGIETLEFYATPFAIPPFLCIPLPENSAEFLGTTSSIQVKGLINNIPFQLNAYPADSDRHFFMLSHQLQSQAAIIMGEEAYIIIEKPKLEPISEKDIPTEIQNNPPLKGAFEKLTLLKKRKFIEKLKKVRSKKQRIERIQKLLLEDQD